MLLLYLTEGRICSERGQLCTKKEKNGDLTSYHIVSGRIGPLQLRHHVTFFIKLWAIS